MTDVQKDRILVVAAHPDDEVLGCGGAVARHVDEGCTVDVVIVAEGALSRADATSADVESLKLAAAKAAHLLGANGPTFLGLPDNRLDTVPLLDVVQHVERIVGELRPTIVYTHHAGDLNIDHQVVHRAVVSACRPIPGQSIRTIRTFETVSSTEWSFGVGLPFVPTLFVDISAALERKLAALEAYHSEMRDFPHPRSADNVRALAHLRGATAGLRAAEAFMTVRDVIR